MMKKKKKILGGEKQSKVKAFIQNLTLCDDTSKDDTRKMILVKK